MRALACCLPILERLLRTRPGQAPNRQQAGRRAHSNDLVEEGALAPRNLALLDSPAERFCEREARVGSNRLHDVLAIGDDDSDIVAGLLDTDEARRGEFFNAGSRLGVQVECDVEPLGACCIRVLDNGGVVAAYFCATSAAGSSAVEVLDDAGGERLYAMIGISRLYEDDKSVLGGSSEGDVATGPKDERADVEEGFAGVRGDPLGVPGNSELDAFQEVLLWDAGDGDVARGDRQTVRVIFWTEQ